MLASILIFILVLSVLILVHELGHFFTAKKCGIKVEEFGFGIPPRIWGKKVGETIYSINALPFGGFVRLHGEQEETEETNIRRSFLHKSKGKRALVIVAGVIMNFVLAIVAFAIVYSFSGIPKDTGRIKVVDVAAGSPAEKAGIVVGDIITKVDKVEVSDSDLFISKTSEFKGNKVSYELLREDKTLTVNVSPRENPPEGEGPVGVTITTMELFYPPVWQRPFYGIYYGFENSFRWIGTVTQGLFGIAMDTSQGRIPTEISGPVGIFAIIYEILKTKDPILLVNVIGILSINLAVLNILPLPALDGGRLLFIGIEAVTRKKVSQKTEAIINSIGFYLLIALLLAVTIGDIKKLIIFKGIEGFLNSMGK